MANKLYVEIVADDPRNRGQFIPVERLPQFVKAYHHKTLYRSYYMFEESIVNYFKKHGTLRGYEGIHYLDKIIVDIDGDGDLSKAAGITYEIYQYLTEFCDVSQNNVQVWFSGSKGFHISMTNIFGFEPSAHLHGEVAATFKVFFEKWQDYVDIHPLAMKGLIRCEWSKHNKTGLHKVPLSIQQLLAIANPKPNSNDDDPAFYADPEVYLKQTSVYANAFDNDDDGLIESAKVTGERTQNYLQEKELDKPSTVVTCMQKLFIRGPIEGSRHQDALRLISSWRRQGVVQSLCRIMLYEWLELDPANKHEEWDAMIHQVFSAGYSYGCKDEVMASLCDKDCIFFKNKDYVLDIASVNSIQNNYRDYLDLIHSDHMDIFHDMGFEDHYLLVPGDMAIITGDTGAGKSAMVQNWIDNNQKDTLYVNGEMKEELLYRRFMQIHHGLSKFQVNESIYDGVDLSMDLNHIDILSGNPDINTLEKLISQKNYQVVVIDTTDSIRDKSNNNDFQKMANIIDTCRRLAQQRNYIVILIHHLKKRNDPTKPITLDDLTGNRSNVTKMDHVLALEGSGTNKRLRSLKVRDGDPFTKDFKIDYSTFKFRANDYTRTITRLGSSSSGSNI